MGRGPVQRRQLIAPVDWLKRIDAWLRRPAESPLPIGSTRKLVALGLEASSKSDKKPKGWALGAGAMRVIDGVLSKSKKFELRSVSDQRCWATHRW
jgi:ADP-ribosylglycohydrolase